MVWTALRTIWDAIYGRQLSAFSLLQYFLTRAKEQLLWKENNVFHNSDRLYSHLGPGVIISPLELVLEVPSFLLD